MVHVFQVCPVNSAAERNSAHCWQWLSSQAQPSMLQLTTDRCWTHTQDSRHCYTRCTEVQKLTLLVCWGDLFKKRWYHGGTANVSLLWFLLVWLVCLGSQHPLHHETTATNRQRCCYHGYDYGHASWCQPVLCTDGHHMASGTSTARCSESKLLTILCPIQFISDIYT